MSHRVVECPGCSSKLRFRSDSQRASITCPRCEQRIVVTRPPEEELEEVYPEEPVVVPEPVVEPEPIVEPESDLFDDEPESPPPRRKQPASRRSEREQRGRSSRRRARSSLFDEHEDELRNEDGPHDEDEFDYFGVEDEQKHARSGVAPFLIGLSIGLVILTIGVGVWWAQKPGDEDTTIADTGNSDNGITVPANPAPLPGSTNQNPVVPPPPARTETPRRPGTVAPPAGQHAAPPAAAGNANAMQYRWAAGDEHIYALKIVADHGGGKQVINGSCTYTIRNNGRDNTEHSQGSGTGFVIAANGYIATCAHVVDGARDIQVTLAGRTYGARVVLTRPELDLAIVQISAGDLPVAPLGNSDSVQLAEPMRAFGFPLSSLLGTGIKVATGTVAGIVQHPRRGKQIQTDAPINPGNSGGPMVNSAGQVIGIASSKIASRAASSVGFAVPVNKLKALMQELGLPAAPTGDGKPLDGPGVARRITPTVAYIKVSGVTGKRVYDVGFMASYVQSEQVDPRQFRFGGFPSFPTHTDDRGVLQVSNTGEIIEATGDESLPFVLGPIGQFFIEPLDPYGDNTWSTEAETALNIVKRESNDPIDRMRSRMGFGPGRRPGFGGGFGRGFGPPGLDPFGQREQEQTIRTIPARERTSYQVKGEIHNRITIQKTYEFVTTENENRPYLLVRGSGELVFDKNLGVPTSLDYQATLIQTEQDGSRSRLPVSITYTRRDNEEVRRERAEAMARLQERKQQQERERTVPDAELVDSLLAEIATKSDASALTPIKRLAGVAIVPERRAQVMQMAEKQLANSNGFVQGSAAEIAAKWATEEHIELLKKVAENRNSLLRNGRKAAIQKLVEFKVPDLLPNLVRQMTDGGIRHDLKKILISAGEAAEQPILEAYPELTDASVRRELLDVLRQIGTERSIDLLTKEATGVERSVRSPAQRALDAIRARQ